jgi:ABC-type Mn2+/Zn2+ transport system permease subunit
VIAEFLASWPLFQNAYLAGWLIGGLLALIGVLVVARDQIFIGAAVSQASTLGAALALRTADLLASGSAAWLAGDAFLSFLAVLSSVVAALLTARGSTAGRESHEARTGWVFLLSASFAILLVAHSPHGLQEVQRLLSSSIIGATTLDLWLLGGLVVVALGVLVVAHRPLLLLAMDAEMAAAVGLRVERWSAATALALGLAVGLSMHCAGLLYTFGCLVLPPLVARNLVREVRPMFVVAPLIALGTGLCGFVLANYYDYPPAQMTVALLCALLALSRLRWRLVP